MAIRASIKYRSLALTASFRKLSLTARIPTATAVVTEKNLHMDASYRSISTDIGYTKLEALASWQNLFMHDITVNAERTIYTFNDAVPFLELTEMDVGLALGDSFSFSEAMAMSLDVVKADTFPMIESIYTELTMFRTLSDQQSISDSSVMSVHSAQSDQSQIIDAISLAMAFGRSFDDLVSFADQATFGTSKIESDLVSMVESISLSPSVTVSDSAIITDAIIATVGQIKVDSLGMLESLSVTRPPFTFTQSGDVVTVTGVPEDTFGFSDSNVFNVNKDLQDTFTLDDFSQVDKHTTGVKTNVYQLTDILSLSLSKALENQEITLTEQHLFALSKPETDAIIVSETLLLSASKVADEQLSLNDVTVLSPRKSVSDSVSLSDNFSFESVVASSVLNENLVGNLLLNAD